MTAYIAIFLSLICIVLLVSVLIKFKKLFSTESIIEKTKVQMNKIISDINKNANMDIDLINDATRRTRNLIQDADEKLEQLKEATDILRNMIATVEKGGNVIPQEHSIYKNSLIDEIKPVAEINKKKKSIESNTYGDKVRSSLYKGKISHPLSQQQSLFDEEQQKENKITSKSKAVDYAENYMPKIVTNIMPDENNFSKKSLNDKVEKLFRSGMQVEDIAVELSCSISEVQFIIDMLNERG